MLTPEQTKIYEGLKQIGDAIANFYLDALNFIDPSCTIPSKANLIAHLAREIDGGIRDAFSPIKKKKEAEKDLQKQGLKDVGHFASILVLLGKDDPKDTLATEWFQIATQFPALAHRHKIYKNSLSADEIILLWNKYEKILFIVVGSFYAITNRLDGLITYFSIDEDGLLILKNLLSISENSFYFFRNLSNESVLDTLESEGYFKIENAPKPNEEGIIIEWYALRYLFNISSTENTVIEKKIADIVDTITQGYIEERILLYSLSLNIITDIIVNLKSYSFSNQTKVFFKTIHVKATQPAWNIYSLNIVEKGPEKYLKNSDKDSIANLLDYVFGYSVSRIPGAFLMDMKLADEVHINFFVGDYLISDFTKKYGREIVKLIGCSAIKICLNKIRNIKKERPFSFSSMDFPSIEVTSQSHTYNIWETELVNFVRDYACYLPPDEKKELIAHLFESDVEILRRLGLHFIRINFVLYQEFWWKFISEYNIDDINIHEPYVIIQQTSSTYSSEQVKLTIDWIEKIKEYEVNTEGYSATDNRYYNIRKWLLAFDEMAKNNDDYLKEKVSYYDGLNSWSFEHPEFSSYYTSYIGEGIPKDSDQLQHFSVEEQISYIKDFQPDHYNNITERGLSQLLSSLVADNPNKYLSKIELFLSLQSIYVNGFLEGLTSAVKSSKVLDYKPVLDFIEQKINSESFINEEKGERDYRRWLVSSITRLIDALIQTQPLFDFEKEGLLRLETVVITLLKNQDFFDTKETISHSHLDQVLNSLQGQLLESLLHITTAWTEKFTIDGSNKKWNATTEEYFTNRLSREGIADKDFSIILGVYLSWFLYFDKDWVYSNANKIFDENNKQHFTYTLHGCLSSFFQKSRTVYDFLKANNIFSKAVEELTSKGREVDALTTYALFEWKFIKIEISDVSSILNQIGHNQNYEQFDSLIRESRITRWLNNEEKKTIVKYLLNIISGNESLNLIYGKLLWLLEDVYELNDEIGDLVKEISHNVIHDNYHLNYYMKHVFKLADPNLLLAGNVVTDILQNEKMVIPHDDNLVVFVNKLYENSLKDLADGICIIVSEKGSLLLKDVYNVHQ